MKYGLIGILLFISVSLFSFLQIYSPLHKSERFFLEDSNIQLQNPHLIIGSEILLLDSQKLVINKDYQIDYSTGKISLNVTGKELIVNYEILPEKFGQKKFVFQKQSFQDSTIVANPFIKPKNKFSNSEISISGNKTIAFSLGNNNDLKFDQSLFLQIEGNVSQNVKIQAQLSDTETPFSPEGDSKELSSLDQILIRIYSPKFDVSFGDLVYEIKNTNLMKLNYHFEGVKGSWHDKQNFSAALAVSTSKHKSITITGIEGKQGPYYLQFGESNNGIKVIAGSESVFLDGLKMERGTDYRISYDEGDITFYQKQIITSESQIMVNYEYSDEDFRKNVYLTSAYLNLPYNFNSWYNFMIQNDDKNNPLNDSFSPSELAELGSSGDNDVWVSGVTEVEVGTGSYVLNSEQNPYYIFDEESGNYDIVFSFIGTEKGNYERINFSEFEYVGENMGSWIPQKKLSAPKKLDNYNFGFKFSKSDLHFSNEILLSQHDLNTFSELDDKNNFGFVTDSSINWKPNYDKISPQIKFNYKHFSKDVTLISQIENPINDYQQTGFAKIDSVEKNELSFQTKIDFFKNFQIHNISQYIDYQNVTIQKGFDNRITLKQRNFFPQLKLRYFTFDENNKLNNYKKTKNQYELNLYLKQHYWSTSNNFNYQKTESDYLLFPENDMIINKNFSIQSENIEKYVGSLSILLSEKSNDYSSDYFATTYQTKQFFKFSNNSFNINYSQRKIDYETGSESSDQKFDFLEFITSNSFLNKAISLHNNYNIDNTEFYPKERELVFVGESIGIFDSTGVYSEDGEYDWEYVNVGQPELVTEVKLNSRISFHPNRFKKFQSNKFLKRFKFDTSYLQSEKSDIAEKYKIYLLLPNYTFDANNSIFSRLVFRQTLWYDLIPKKMVLKYSFENDNSLDNRYVTAYKRDIRSHYFLNRLTGYYHAIFEILYKTSHESESKYNSIIDNKELDFSVKKQISKKFISDSNIAFSTESGENENSTLKYDINSYQIGSKLSYFPNNKSKINIELACKKNNKTGDDYFNFAISKRDGMYWNWGIIGDYKYNSFTSFNLKYTGDISPNEIVEHNLMIEVVAEF